MCLKYSLSSDKCFLCVSCHTFQARPHLFPFIVGHLYCVYTSIIPPTHGPPSTHPSFASSLVLVSYSADTFTFYTFNLFFVLRGQHPCCLLQYPRPSTPLPPIWPTLLHPYPTQRRSPPYTMFLTNWSCCLFGT